MKEKNITRKDKLMIFAVIIGTVIIAPKIESFFLSSILPTFKQGTHEAGVIAAIATFASILITMCIVFLILIMYKKLRIHNRSK